MMTRGRILVVDDDPDVVRLLSLRLSKDGYEVSSAADGVACMAHVRREDPDLVVLDLGIPAGDGYLTLERLRDNPHWARLPVVVLTASSDADARASAMRAGAHAFFQTTAGTQEFLETISRLLKGDPPSAL